MSGKTDVVKGRLEEAAGALTGNDQLRAEAAVEQDRQADQQQDHDNHEAAPKHATSRHVHSQK
jgi:uncharacterized protein YjbJ (UPF0337 family)